MTKQEFLSYIGAVDVCKTRMNWHETRFRVPVATTTSDTTFTVYDIRIEQEGEMEIAAFQWGSRRKKVPTVDIGACLLKEVEEYTPKSVELQGRFYVIVGCTGRTTRTRVSFEVHVEKGDYIVVPLTVRGHGNTVKHPPAFARNFSLVLYSDMVLHCHPRKEKLRILGKVLIHRALQSTNCVEVNSVGQAKVLKHKDHAGFTVIATNSTQQQFYTVEVDLQGSSGVETSRQSLRTEDSLGPQCHQLLSVVTFTQLDKGASLKESYSGGLSRKSLPSVPALASNTFHNPTPFF